jgi:hypothetical protein
MPFSRSFPILLAVAGAALLTGALPGPARQPPAPQEQGPAAPAGLAAAAADPLDPALTGVVDRAIGVLAEPRLAWQRAGVWLRARLGDLAFTAEGRYLRAPGQRFRLELHTRLDALPPLAPPGALEGTALSVSDGRDLWSACAVGADGWTEVKRLRTAEVLAGPAAAPALRNEFLAGHALRGPELLLRDVQSHMGWVRHEQVAAGVRLTGRWKEWVRANLLKGQTRWPAMLPRYCRLTLSAAATGWPSRVEYWGPRVEDGPDRLLVEMEFRDPAFGLPLSDDDCAGLFTFDPGNAPVEDLTPKVHAAVNARARELNLPQP